MGQVIDKTAQVLQLVGLNEPCSLKELTALTGMKKPTLFLILKSLVATGFLEKRTDAKYLLGSGLFALTRRRSERECFRETVRREAERLAADLGESITVAALVEGRYVKLHAFSGDQPIAISPRLLEETRFYRNATGRVLLANAAPEVVAVAVKATGLPTPSEWPEAVTEEGLRLALATIHAEGQAEKTTADGQVVFWALPVVNVDPDEILALGVGVPAFRFQGERREAVIAALRAAAVRCVFRTPKKIVNCEL